MSNDIKTFVFFFCYDAIFIYLLIIVAENKSFIGVGAIYLSFGRIKHANRLK